MSRIGLALLGILLAGSAASPAGAQPAQGGGEDRVRIPEERRIGGVSLVAPRTTPAPERMRGAAEVGADWVAVIPYAFLRTETGEVVFERRRQFRGERSEGIREQVALAREHGLRVLLKPHVWTRGLWIGDYVPADEEAWERWIEGYRAYALHMARLAVELDVELFAVGTELKEVVGRRPGWMEALIHEVREIYGGELTYAANWDEYTGIPFWSELDYIGVNAYFPLRDDPVPEVELLVREWDGVLGTLERFSRRHGRPILITEFGYRSVERAAGPHWELPNQRSAPVTRAGMEAQARAYEAFFRAWWDEPWVAGAFLWKWFLEDGNRGWGGDRYRATGFTPQGKPAEEVIRRWYGRP